MSKLELRKAMNGLGLSVDDDTLEKLIELYQGEEFGSAEYSKFVEDVDPTAFNYAFCAGLCAKSGTFEKIEKEGVVSYLDPVEKVRNTLKAALQARKKKDGMTSVIKEIQQYGDHEGKLTLESFRAALLRLGLKIDRKENMQLAFAAFTTPEGVMDVWNFSKMAEADFERVPRLGDRNESHESPKEKKMRQRTAASPKDKMIIGASTIVEPKPFG